MFELNPSGKIGSSNPTEISVKKKQEIEYLPLGKIIVKRGHTLFEIDTISGEISEAQYHIQSANYELLKGIAQSKIGSLIVKKGCVYIPALNKKNALKKYNQSPVQRDYYVKEAIMKL